MGCSCKTYCLNTLKFEGCDDMTHTGETPESVSLNGTFELSNNVFQENVANSIGAAVAFPLTAFTFRTQTVTVFQNK